MVYLHCFDNRKYTINKNVRENNRNSHVWRPLSYGTLKMIVLQKGIYEIPRTLVYTNMQYTFLSDKFNCPKHFIKYFVIYNSIWKLCSFISEIPVSYKRIMSALIHGNWVLLWMSLRACPNIRVKKEFWKASKLPIFRL